MKNKIALFIAATALFSCQKDKKEELTHLLTKDSIQYFDVYTPGEFKRPRATFSFDKDGKNEQYTFRDDKNRERYIVPLSDKPNNLGMTNTWKIVNDSTIELTGEFSMVVKRYTEDTIFVNSDRGELIWVRVKGDPRLNEEALYARDSLLDMKRRQAEKK
jgi:hypothetical protein